MDGLSVGSICSGIEAASVAWSKLGFHMKWFSENSSFPSKLLDHRYPHIENHGDMNFLAKKIDQDIAEAPDIICGGTPCQAFSLAGWKKGLEDDRGNLTLEFVNVVNEVDKKRKKAGLAPCLALWENVEGVLRDKTNPFGCLVSSLAGFDSVIRIGRWPNAGLLRGPSRNVAWRVLDAKYFGLPQQRRRLYVVSGGKNLKPENILFDKKPQKKPEIKKEDRLSFMKNEMNISVFRSYTDCLYSAYGTKWNGNAAAYNGSLFVVQDCRIRRFTPLESERLMGFPDKYTDIEGAKPTNRYQALGNSWAVPVVKWIGNMIKRYPNENFTLKDSDFQLLQYLNYSKEGHSVFDFSDGSVSLPSGSTMNTSVFPENYSYGSLFDVIDTDAEEKFYLSPAGCGGILRRSKERNIKINIDLKNTLSSIASTWTEKKIEEISRTQKRGRYSTL